MLIVPLVVIGEPVIVSASPVSVKATLVTVPCGISAHVFAEAAPPPDVKANPAVP